jgi:hypothetical protein
MSIHLMSDERGLMLSPDNTRVVIGSTVPFDQRRIRVIAAPGSASLRRP